MSQRPVEFEFAYFVSYSHRSGFGSSEFWRKAPIESYDDVREIAKEIESGGEVRDVIILNWIRYPGSPVTPTQGRAELAETATVVVAPDVKEGAEILTSRCLWERVRLIQLSDTEEGVRIFHGDNARYLGAYLERDMVAVRASSSPPSAHTSDGSPNQRSSSAESS